MTKMIALVNQKGGTGKTTSTVNIAAGLANKGKRVLTIDLDPQGSLTASLGIQTYNNPNTIYEVLKGQITAQESIIKKDFDIIPSDIRLSGAEIELSSIPGRETILKEVLEPIVNNYDYILIDSPPSLTLLTLNGLVAAKEIYITLQPEYLALLGMSQLIKTIETVKKRLNQDLEVTGIIITMYDNRKILNKEVIDNVEEYFPDKIFNTKIRNNVALAEAPAQGLDIFSYKPGSNGAEDYNNLVDEILKRR
ncbi:MAG: ParA family protein [Peptococcales bacterium]|jgi:chromosome partitioning protein